MKGPVTRQKVGLGFSQFRENWCPTCEETFQTELSQPRPLSCRRTRSTLTLLRRNGVARSNQILGLEPRVLVGCERRSVIPGILS